MPENQPIPAAVEAAEAVIKNLDEWHAFASCEIDPDEQVRLRDDLAAIIAEKMAPAREREVEAAYGEAWQVRNNYGRLEAQGANQSDQDFDWENSKARAALGKKEGE